MIKADVPQDVTEYKEQFFFGMTVRQFVCIIAMLIFAVVTFLLGRDYLSTDILMYLIVAEVAPLAEVGFLKYNGMSFEKIAAKVAEFYAGKQHRKIRYLPPETEIHDMVRELLLSVEERERKAELKEEKAENKKKQKAEKKRKRSEKNAD